MTSDLRELLAKEIDAFVDEWDEKCNGVWSEESFAELAADRLVERFEQCGWCRELHWSDGEPDLSLSDTYIPGHVNERVYRWKQNECIRDDAPRHHVAGAPSTPGSHLSNGSIGEHP